MWSNCRVLAQQLQLTITYHLIWSGLMLLLFLKFVFIEYDGVLNDRENYRFFSLSRDQAGSRLEEKLLVTVVVTGNYVMKLGNTKP